MRRMIEVEKYINILKEMIRKIMFQIKLWEMDRRWYFFGGSCWQLFPPSFYYTHTEEEIKQITKETVEKLTKMIDEL